MGVAFPLCVESTGHTQTGDHTKESQSWPWRARVDRYNEPGLHPCRVSSGWPENIPRQGPESGTLCLQHVHYPEMYWVCSWFWFLFRILSLCSAAFPDVSCLIPGSCKFRNKTDSQSCIRVHCSLTHSRSGHFQCSHDTEAAQWEVASRQLG